METISKHQVKQVRGTLIEFSSKDRTEKDNYYHTDNSYTKNVSNVSK